MSIYFVTSLVESKHHKKYTGPNSNNRRSPGMPYGFPAFPQSTFPNDKPPTLFHPASPKIKPAKPAKDVDAASMASTSTFASTVSLLKDNVKAKFHSKDSKTRKAAAETTVEYEGEKTSSSKPRKEPSPRARTAEAYMVMAVTK